MRSALSAITSALIFFIVNGSSRLKPKAIDSSQDSIAQGREFVQHCSVFNAEIHGVFIAREPDGEGGCLVLDVEAPPSQLQGRNFDLNGEARTARTKQSSPIISASLGDYITSSTRIRFSVHTGSYSGSLKRTLSGMLRQPVNHRRERVYVAVIGTTHTSLRSAVGWASALGESVARLEAESKLFARPLSTFWIMLPVWLGV
jgi:hypothetical protein